MCLSSIHKTKTWGKCNDSAYRRRYRISSLRFEFVVGASRWNSAYSLTSYNSRRNFQSHVRVRNWVNVRQIENKPWNLRCCWSKQLTRRCDVWQGPVEVPVINVWDTSRREKQRLYILLKASDRKRLLLQYFKKAEGLEPMDVRCSIQKLRSQDRQ